MTDELTTHTILLPLTLINTMRYNKVSIFCSRFVMTNQRTPTQTFHRQKYCMKFFAMTPRMEASTNILLMDIYKRYNKSFSTGSLCRLKTTLFTDTLLMWYVNNSIKRRHNNQVCLKRSLLVVRN